MTPSAKFDGQAFSVNRKDEVQLHHLEGLRWHTLQAFTAKGRAAQQSLSR